MDVSGRWQDESWDAPTQTPAGFAMPPAGALGDIIYRPDAMTVADPDAPAPQSFAAPTSAAPPLDALVPAPAAPRDPTQPFHTASDTLDTAAWDPHTPLVPDASPRGDDAWPGEEHPSFPAPTGRPVTASTTWRPPAYPSQADVVQPRPMPPRPVPTYAPQQMPPVAHIARPEAGPTPPHPSDPYQAMHQPYPQARPWQTDPGAPAPVYRPGAAPRQSVQLDWWTLVLLAAGIIIGGWSWVFLAIAWIVAGTRRMIRPAVSLAFSICGPLLLVVWIITVLSPNVEALYAFYTNPPLYSIVARICCIVVAAVMLIDFGIARGRRDD